MSELATILNDLHAGTFQSDEQKFAAMRGAGRPEDGYYSAINPKDRFPSSTTITGRFKDPGGLYRWHHANGAGGRQFGDGGTPALEIGKKVHDMVEARIHGTKLRAPKVTDDNYEAIMSGYNAFTRWFDGNRFRVVATEVPLVSEKHRFGGTLDAILQDHTGAYCLADWKTSNGLYVDYLCQIASYGLLWNENCPPSFRLTGGFHLCRFSKEHGDMTHKHFPSLDDALEQFLLFRQAYENDKALKRRAK